MKRILLFLIAAALVASQNPAPVLVPVTVTDSLGRAITGLDPGAFRLYEDKVEQKVSLQDRSLPLSVGIVLDTSDSMAGKLGDFPRALSTFLPIALAEPDDEAFLIAFSDRPVLVQSFTHDKAAIENQIPPLQLKGRTALNDAVYLGLTEMEHAKNPRKVLVVVSDGFNHGGVYSGADVIALARKSGVEIYSVGFSDVDPIQPSTRVNQAGMEVLRQLSEPTGGRNFEDGSLIDTFPAIGIELRSQYLLAYTPTNQTHDGKFRKIMIKVGAMARVQSPRTFSMAGYYAPAH